MFASFSTIPQVLWDRVQRKLQRAAATYEQSCQKMAHLMALQSRHLLTGLVRCAICGAYFIARPGYKRTMGKKFYNPSVLTGQNSTPGCLGAAARR